MSAAWRQIAAADTSYIYPINWRVDLTAVLPLPQETITAVEEDFSLRYVGITVSHLYHTHVCFVKFSIDA